MNVVSIILSIVSMICAGLSIGFTLSARNDEKKLEELRREQEQTEREERIKRLKEEAETHIKNCMMISQEIDQILEEDTDKGGSDYSESGDHDTYYS